MEHGEGKELLMIQSIQHHLLNKVNAVSLVFIDDVSAGGRSRINSEVCRATLWFSQILQNWSHSAS